LLLFSELLYEGEGCTVELITDERSVINFTTGMKDRRCKELEKCNGRLPNFEIGFSNL